MEKNWLFLILLTIACRQGLSQSQCKELVYFDKGSYSLNNQVKTQLKQFAGTLREQNVAAITVSGYADEQGDSAYNMALSKKRAYAVRNFLTASGINKNIITMQCLGETGEPGQSKNDIGNEKARKVELAVKLADDLESVLCLECKKRLNKLTLHSTIMRTSKETTRAIFESTIFTIATGSLLMPGGAPVTEDVEIDLRIYKPSEMVRLNFSGPGIGQSPEYLGVIHLAAHCNCAKIQLRKGRPLEIIFHAGKKTLGPDGLEAFAGVQQGNSISWVASELVSLDPDISAKETDKNNKAVAGKMNGWKINSEQFGWISYARTFTPGEKTNLRIETDTSCQPLVRLFFKDINSMMVPDYKTTDGAFIFENVPVGRKATLVITGSAAGKVKYALKEITIGVGAVQKLMLLKTGAAEMQKALEQLDP